MKNLSIRLLTAVFAVPIILGLLYYLPWSAFGLLAAAAAVVASIEFYQMTHRDDRPGQFAGLALTLGLFATLLFTNFGATQPFAALAATVLVTPVALLFTLFNPRDQNTAFGRMTALAMGPVYLGAALAALAALRRIAPDRTGANLVVLTLMVAWFSDTAGYFVGKSLKGPKLYPSVSPNKTWSGSIGGLGGSAGAAVLAHFVYMPELPLARGILVAVVAGAFGQAGDLCESLMKRSAGVKDSGGILPGHGGILDRIDALLFAGLGLYLAVRSGWLPLASR
jgi:phosphatidate cytidylyltransferase